MKRNASPIDSGRERRRQDPVSCSLCRSKKLKCSREQPCSNCASRGIDCDFLPSRPSHNGYAESNRKSPGNDPVIADVLARLRRLERAVLDNKSSQSSPNTWSEVNQPVTNRHAVDRRAASSTFGQEVEHDKAFDDVENTTIHNNAVDLAHTDRITYAIKSVKDLVADAGLYQHRCPHGGISLPRHVWLPQEHEAIALFEEYKHSTGTVYHFLHFPTTKRQIQDLYAHLARRQNVESGHLALLLAIVSTGAYFYNSTRSPVALFANAKAAEEASLMWRKWGLDVLESNRRSTDATIEDIQATVLIAHLIANLEGFSSRTRILHAVILTMARDLSLHVMDSPHHPRRDVSSDYITLEIKRRLWWYIVATDWIMAFVHGPQEGSYNVELKHMCVKLPKNIDDDDLTADTEAENKPMCEPTELSYFIFRATASNFTRMVIDAQPPASAPSSIIDPTDFLMLEFRFRETMASLPIYFQLERANDPEIVAMHLARPELSMQRAVINQGAWLMAIRLHRPYLFRRSPPPPYDRSRDACVQAARKCIEVRRSMDHIKSNFAVSRSRVTFIVHHTFMALVVLALDLCFNEFPSHEAREERRKEVREASRTMEDTRDGSGVAARYLAPLLEVLRKHRINLQDSSETQQSQQQRPLSSSANGAVVGGSGIGDRGFGGIVIPSSGSDGYNTPQSHGIDVVEGGGGGSLLWEDMFDFPSTGLDATPDWQQLFADLDSTYTF